jgi:hypothetical protein
MENSLTAYQNKAKGLFEQKGGTLGMVLLALGVVALIVFFQPILAIIQLALTNILGIIALVGVIAAILFLVFDKNSRMLVGTLYMMAIRSLMGAVIKMNPIAILEDTIKEMYKRIDNVEDKMGKLNGVRLKFKDKIKTKKKELQDCLDRKAAADKVGNRSVSILEGRQSERLIDITKEYMDLQESSENWYNTLSKIAEQAKIVAEDADNEVKIQKEKYEMVKDSHNAFKSAMSILRGDPDELARYNQAFDFVSKDIMDKVGEMDRVINTTGGMIDKMDIDKEMYSIKGDDISKKYAELGIDAFFSKMEALPSTQMNKLQVSNMTIETPVLQKSKSKYFSN